MKRKLVLFTAFIALASIFTIQAQDIHNRPCIDVSRKAEMFVEPDEIILSIVINEKDYSKKTTLENLEKEMIKSLKGIGIDTKKCMRFRFLIENQHIYDKYLFFLIDNTAHKQHHYYNLNQSDASNLQLF